MEFKKFNSIENSYRTRFLNKIVEEGHAGKKFVVTEKVHGANFSFWSNDVKTVCGKRSALMGEGESFHNFQSVLKKYYSGLRNMFAALQADRNAKEVAVFGELYGGSYPHPEVPKVQNASKVQGDVYYNPAVDFYGFDVMVDGVILDVAEANLLMDTYGIPRAQTLFEGSLEECLKYPNEFHPTLPKLLGLPEIAGNVCEGVVVRPAETTYLWSGERLILKNKNAKFSEKDKEPKKLKDTPKGLDETSQKVLDTLSTYINENRLKNVLSKMGQVGQGDFGKIMGLLNQDALEDFNKDNEGMLESLDKDSRHQVTKRMGQMSAMLVRSQFQNILDGCF